MDYLRKILVYLVTLLRLMNDFVSLKQAPERAADSTLARLVEKCRVNQVNVFKNQVPVRERLLGLSLQQLVDEVDIRDVGLYVLIVHRFMAKKDKHATVRAWHRGRVVEFSLNSNEQHDLLCCKTKRRDEIVKFSFKFIRRQLISGFRPQVPGPVDRLGLKSEFNRRYLQSDPAAVAYFESFDISRKGLHVLRRFGELRQMMEAFCKTGYIEALVRKYICRQRSGVLDDSTGFEEFADEMMSRQHKNSTTLQGALNSLEQFREFFIFDSATGG